MIIDPPSFADYLALKAEIAELKARLKRKDNLIEKLRRKSGIKARTSKTEVIKMLVDGRSVDDVAASIGCKKSTVYRIRKQIGIGNNAA